MKKITLFLFMLLTISSTNYIFSEEWTETYDDQTSSSYLSSFTCAISGVWTASQAGNFNMGNPRSGSKCLAINDDKSNAHATTPSLNTCGTVSFWYYQRYGNSSDEFELQVSENGGDFDTKVTQSFNVGETYTLFSYDVNSSSNNVKIRVLNNNNKGHLIIDDFSVSDYSTTSPTINLSESSLTGFYYLLSNGPSSEQSFTVDGSNLTADISIVPPTNYEISLTTGGSFVATNPIILAQDVNGEVATTSIYVRLKSGLSVADYNDEEITASSTDATSKIVTCSGSVTAPVTLPYSEDFSDCATQEWTAVSVASNKDWTCGSSYQSINGYGGDGASNDYLISPVFNLNNYNNEVISFESWNQYADVTYPPIELLYTTSYTGDPATTSWTSLTATWCPENTETWTSSGNIDISNISSSTVRFAFHYITSGTGGGTTSSWKIDEISITGFTSSSWKTDAITTDWHTASNWDNEIVPTATTNVTIPVGATNYPTITASATCNNLTLESNASGDASLIGQSNLTVNGTTTVQRYATAEVWHGFSSPVSGADFNSLYLNGSPDVWGKSYDESDNEYDYASTLSTPLGDMKGWMLWIDGSTAQTFDITGSLRSGTVGAVDNLVNSVPDASHGYNFVGNPFPSAIDWDATSGWTKTNISDGFWILDDANDRFVTYSTSSGGLNGGTQYISSGQAFFVQVDAAASNGTLQMTDAVQVHNSVGFFKDQNVISNLIKLRVSDELSYDESIIRLDSQATEGFDNKLDMHKMFSYNESLPQLFSTANDNMAINVLPMETVSVDMDVRGENGSEMTISVVDVSDFAQVFLSDDLLGTQTNLMESPYVFTYDAAETNRFTVYFTVVGIEDNMLENVQVYSFDKKIKIEVPVQMNAKVELVNLMGQKLSETNINFGTHELNMAHTGYYLVRIIGNNSSVTRKVFIK